MFPLLTLVVTCWRCDKDTSSRGSIAGLLCILVHSANGHVQPGVRKPVQIGVAGDVNESCIEKQERFPRSSVPESVAYLPNVFSFPAGNATRQEQHI